MSGFSGEIEPCINCGASMEVYIADMQDYEYGVPWSSVLVRCPRCHLVAQHPRVSAEDISKLYPDNYFVHTVASKRKGIYSFLKRLLDAKKIRRLKALLPKDGVFVEVGCGSGEFLLALERVRPDLTLIGIDIVDPGSFVHSRVKFYIGQLERLNISSDSVDLIYFDDLIEHVVDPVLFLQESHRILKPGGAVFGITPDHDSVDRWVFGKYWAGYHYPRHTFLFDHNNINRMLEKTRFECMTPKGSNGLWVKSAKNLLMKLPSTKKRGLLHYGFMILVYPIDLLINLFTCHGEMSFAGTRR